MTKVVWVIFAICMVGIVAAGISKVHFAKPEVPVKASGPEPEEVLGAVVKANDADVTVTVNKPVVGPPTPQRRGGRIMILDAFGPAVVLKSTIDGVITNVGVIINGDLYFDKDRTHLVDKSEIRKQVAKADKIAKEFIQ